MTKVIQTVRNSFAALMEAAAPFESSPIVAVAVSGGSDSLALIHLADEWAKERGGRAIAITVDHGLRTASLTEAETVHEWLKNVDIEHHILHWQGIKPESNIQAEARIARYGLLSDWCNQNAILHCLIAHHQDDQAETFLLRLQRGSGVDGLAAMPLVTHYLGVRIIRPLLDLSKTDLQHFLTAKGLRWIEDPSNSNPHYVRSHIRQFLTAPFANSTEQAIISPSLFASRLAQSAEHMGRARASLEARAADAMLSTTAIYPEGYCCLQRDNFNRLLEEEALRILSSILTTISGRYYKPRFEELTRLYLSIRSTTPFKGVTLWGCYLFAKGGMLICCREPAAVQESIALSPGKGALWDNRFQVCVKNAGIRVEALGAEGLHVIKKHCPAISLPKPIIITLPAFKSLESVIAVPHIHFYSSRTEGTEIDSSKQVSACFSPTTPLVARTFHYKKCRNLLISKRGMR